MSFNSTIRGTRQAHHREARQAFPSFAKTEFDLSPGHGAFLHGIGLKSPFLYTDKASFIETLKATGFDPSVNQWGAQALAIFLEYRPD